MEKWNEKYEKPVQSLEAVLAEFKNTGVRDVFVLPFALVADQCYQKMRKAIAAFTYNTERNAMRIHVGKPLLSSLGVKNYADDYVATIDAIMKHVNIRALNKSILLMAKRPKSIGIQCFAVKMLIR